MASRSSWKSAIQEARNHDDSKFRNMNKYTALLLLASLTSLFAAESFPERRADYHGFALCEVPVGSCSAQVLIPCKPAAGRPWVIASSLYALDSEPVANMARTQLELVKQGFHVVAISPGAILGAPDPEKRWDAAYRLMTERYILSHEVVLMGLSREGLPVLRWAAENPGKVSCLYLDKAVCDFKSWPGGKLGKGKGSPKDWEQLLKVYGFANESEAMAYSGNPVDLTEKLAAARVGIIYVAGAEDDVVPFSENGAVLQKFYESKGLFFRLMMRPKEGHHPHGLSDPAEIVRFIRMNTYAVPPTRQLVAYGPHYSQVLDFWKTDSPLPTPVVIYIHGGGWNQGTRRDVGGLEDYLKAGISVVAVDYRFIAQANAEGLLPPVRGPMHDAARALQFVRTKAVEWGLRTDRIGLTGGSAGACSSLWLAFHKDLADAASADPVARQSTRPYCVAVQVPQTTLDPQQMKEWTPNSRYGGHAFGVKGGFAAFLEQRESLLPWISEYSPYALATADAPPVYLNFNDAPNVGHEQKDPTHTANFGVKLQERLRQLNVPCELVYPGAPDVKHERVIDYLIEKLKESAGK
jgi:acetyl esterase/lipase